MGRQARLAAEIPDIFIPLARNENSGMTMVLALLRFACERILPTVVSDIRRGDSRDGKRGRGG